MTLIFYLIRELALWNAHHSRSRNAKDEIFVLNMINNLSTHWLAYHSRNNNNENSQTNQPLGQTFTLVLHQAQGGRIRRSFKQENICGPGKCNNGPDWNIQGTSRPRRDMGKAMQGGVLHRQSACVGSCCYTGLYQAPRWVWGNKEQDTTLCHMCLVHIYTCKQMAYYI